MARTIEQIKQDVTAKLTTRLSLSTSAAAEWRMWVHCVSYAIYLFEACLDVFKKEMDEKADTIVPGSLTWYSEMCYRFQFGHKLLFNKSTAALYYEKEDPEAKVVKIASVREVNGWVLLKIATKNEEGLIVPLSDIQLLNFRNYMDAVKFAGSKIQVISTDADIVRYRVKVWHNPAVPTTSLEEEIRGSLDAFRTEQSFDGMFYSTAFVDAVKRVPGVVTAKLTSLERRSSNDADYEPVDIRADLYAGYFNYDAEECGIELININDLE